MVNQDNAPFSWGGAPNTDWIVKNVNHPNHVDHPNHVVQPNHVDHPQPQVNFQLANAASKFHETWRYFYSIIRVCLQMIVKVGGSVLGGSDRGKCPGECPPTCSLDPYFSSKFTITLSVYGKHSSLHVTPSHARPPNKYTYIGKWKRMSLVVKWNKNKNWKWIIII